MRRPSTKAVGVVATILTWFPLTVLLMLLRIPAAAITLVGSLACSFGGYVAGTKARRLGGGHGVVASLLGILPSVLLTPLTLLIVVALKLAALTATAPPTVAPTVGVSTAHGVGPHSLVGLLVAPLLLGLSGGYLGGKPGERLGPT